MTNIAYDRFSCHHNPRTLVLLMDAKMDLLDIIKTMAVYTLFHGELIDERMSISNQTFQMTTNPGDACKEYTRVFFSL